MTLHPPTAIAAPQKNSSPAEQRALREREELRRSPWVFSSPKILARALRENSIEDAAEARAAYDARAPKRYDGLADLLTASDAIEMLSCGKLDLRDTSWGRMAMRWSGVVNVGASDHELRNDPHAVSPFAIDSTPIPLHERIALAGAVDTWRGRIGSRPGMHPLDLIKAASHHDPSLSSAIEKSLHSAIGMWAKSAAHMRNNNEPVGSRMASARRLLEAHGSPEIKSKFEQALAPFARPKTIERTGEQLLVAKKQQAWMRAFKGAMELDVPEVLETLYEGARARGFDPLAPEAKIASGRIQRTLLGLACEMGASECALWLCAKKAPSGAVAAGESFLNASNPYLSLAFKCMEASAQNTFTPDSQKSWEKAFGAVEERMESELAELGLPARALSEMRAMVESLPAKIAAGAQNRDTQSVSGIIPAASLSLITTRSWEPDYPARIGQSQAIFSRAAIKAAIGENANTKQSRSTRL